MMRLRVKEYQWISFADLPGDVERLAALEVHLPKGTIQWGHRKLCFARYCGVVQVDDWTIEVFPKTSETASIDEEQAIFLRMLELVHDLKLYPTAVAHLGWSDFTLLDLFIVRFCEDLERLLLTGMHREYQRQEENLTILRGKIQVADNVRLNPHRPDRIYCAFDELSEDTLLNRILYTTLRHLYGHCRSDIARRLTNELLSRFERVSLWTVNQTELDGLQLNRHTQRFEGVLEQCRWFLHGLSPNVFSGSSTNMALLFSMPLLFECFIAKEVRRALSPHGLRVSPQDQSHSFVGHRDDVRKNYFSLRPDIVVTDGESVVCVMDTKWKLLQAHGNLGVSQDDLYQIATYGSEYKAESLALLYPSTRNPLHPTVHPWTIRGAERPLYIAEVPLGLLADGKESFRAGLKTLLNAICVGTLIETSQQQS